MKPARLYINNFMCYDDAFIDFHEFSVALIVAKTENSSDESNGAGKTTIFRAIEYALFNHSDGNLEDVVRDDMDSCNVTLDFEIGDQEYRVTRTRTRKGASDLTLYKRTASQGAETEVLHNIKNDRYSPISDEKYWMDISGRRAADTEKEIIKLIKVNLKSFRIFVHFLQKDFGGLAAATPEKRKLILKDALNLVIYSKLEKMAKEKSSTLSKEADRFITLIDNLGDLDLSIADLTQKMAASQVLIDESTISLAELEVKSTAQASLLNGLTNDLANLEGKFSGLVLKEQSLNGEKSRLEISVKEYTTKKGNIIKAAHEAIAEQKQLEETQTQLVGLDFNQIDILSEQIVSNKEKVAQLSLTIQNDMARAEKLKKPIPVGGECEECRQTITNEHRKFCQQNLDQELLERQRNIQNCKKEIASLTTANAVHQQSINSLNLSKQHLDSINTKISNKKKEIVDKRATHEEYKTLLERFMADLEAKNKEIEDVVKELQNSSLEESKILQKQIAVENVKLKDINLQISSRNKDIAHNNSAKAVLQHELTRKTSDKKKKTEYTKLLKELEVKLSMYPAVIQAFSSTGIPNLIIKNVLDDLQLETNTLLAQLKPGLQLSFLVEKTRDDGTEVDTLDINYTVNGKKRYYENISGAMQMAVNFSLKLGLSFLLQKMSGIDIKFLLLDEVDQPLDKARATDFANIIKFFQKDYCILVITHNDRLKDKFSHAILVEQDIDMVSRARVVSSW